MRFFRAVFTWLGKEQRVIRGFGGEAGMRRWQTLGTTTGSPQTLERLMHHTLAVFKDRLYMAWKGVAW